jgi:hypothetical protein
MDINQIVNGVGAGLAGALTLWMMGALKRDIERRKNKKK